MKFFNKFFLGVGLLAAPVVQAQQAVPLPGFYQNYYKVTDRERNNSWYHNLNDFNLLGYGYGGGTNQQWMIMPTYPGSSEFIIASRATGDVVNVFGNDGTVRNIDVYRYGFTGGDNQIFKMNPVYGIPGYYTFHSPSMPGTDVERCSSSQAHGAWTRPDKKGNNIIIRRDHFNPSNSNAHFRLDVVEGIPYGPTSYLSQSNNVTPQPPAPVDMSGSNLCVECNEHVMGETYIPFPMVQDLPRHIQVNSTPYYKLQRRQLWKIVETPFIYAAGISQTRTLSLTTGTHDISVQEVEKTLGVTFTNGGEVGFKVGTVGVTMSSSLSQTMTLRTKNTTTHEETNSTTKTYSVTINPSANLLVAEYQLVDRYTLFRADGSTVLSWEVNYHPDYNTRVSYSQPSAGGRLAGGSSLQVVKKGYNVEGMYSIELADRPAKLSNEKQDFGFNVAAVYPNPFQSALQVSLSAPEAAKVSVQLYNVQGQQVKQMAKTIAGSQIVELEAAGLSDGIYMMKVQMVSEADPNRTFSYTKKLVLKK